MKILRPLVGQKLDVTTAVSLEGIASTDVTSVKLMVDNRFSLPDATVSTPEADGTVRWVLSRRFSGLGNRTIVATGFDKSGAEVPGEQASVTIEIVGSDLGNFHPPAQSLGLLGDIVTQLEAATRIPQSLIGCQALFVLPGGQLYFESALQLDTDGSTIPGGDHQDGTSLHSSSGKPLDANAVPYFVLPLGGFTDRFGIELGDLGVVFRQ
jgi:hypothetical protein